MAIGNMGDHVEAAVETVAEAAAGATAGMVASVRDFKSYQ